MEGVSFRRISQGHYSGFKASAEHVFTGADEFTALWQAHISESMPAMPAPAVDFATSMVIAVFRGEKSSGGFGVQITRIEELDAIVVHYELSDPRGVVTMALTQPFDIVAIPVSDKPVRFVGVPAAEPPPAPTTTYLLTFVKGGPKPSSVLDNVATRGFVQGTKLLGVGVGFVYVDSSADAANVVAALSSVDGVASVEQDG